MKRFWIYQRERFPLVAHGILILAFSACAVAYSALLAGAASPSWPAYVVAFGVCLLMFLQLRIADEFKDAGEDARWRPYRPVPRGLVTLAELRMVFIGAGAVQLLLVLWLDARLLPVLAVAWLYLGLMCVEFFCRSWLKARPVIYLITHMGIMPLVDFFGTACEWLPRQGSPPAAIGWFLAASFFNGIVIEVGRKLRQPADEEQGVETYSSLWGRKKAVMLWLSVIGMTCGCALIAASKIDFLWPVAALLGAMIALMLGASRGYLLGSRSGKPLETLSGIWTLILYLMLGLIPLLWRWL